MRANGHATWSRADVHPGRRRTGEVVVRTWDRTAASASCGADCPSSREPTLPTGRAPCTADHGFQWRPMPSPDGPLPAAAAAYRGTWRRPPTRANAPSLDARDVPVAVTLPRTGGPGASGAVVAAARRRCRAACTSSASSWSYAASVGHLIPRAARSCSFDRRPSRLSCARSPRLRHAAPTTQSRLPTAVTDAGEVRRDAAVTLPVDGNCPNRSANATRVRCSAILMPTAVSSMSIGAPSERPPINRHPRAGSPLDLTQAPRGFARPARVYLLWSLGARCPAWSDLDCSHAVGSGHRYKYPVRCPGSTESRARRHSAPARPEGGKADGR